MEELEVHEVQIRRLTINMAERTPVIVEEECIACGACEEICPEVFRVNDSLGFAQVINPFGDSEAQMQEAIEACPVNCIHWQDEMELNVEPPPPAVHPSPAK
jgi:ferredoxin